MDHLISSSCAQLLAANVVNPVHIDGEDVYPLRGGPFDLALPTPFSSCFFSTLIAVTIEEVNGLDSIIEELVRMAPLQPVYVCGIQAGMIPGRDPGRDPV